MNYLHLFLGPFLFFGLPIFLILSTNFHFYLNRLFTKIRNKKYAIINQINTK